MRVAGGRIDVGAVEDQLVGGLVGDMDFDSDVDFDDIDDFVRGLVDPAGYELQFGAPPETNGDTDGDNDQDFDDIMGFVAILSGKPPSGTSAGELGEPLNLSPPLREIITLSPAERNELSVSEATTQPYRFESSVDELYTKRPSRGQPIVAGHGRNLVAAQWERHDKLDASWPDAVDHALQVEWI